MKYPQDEYRPRKINWSLEYYIWANPEIRRHSITEQPIVEIDIGPHFREDDYDDAMVLTKKDLEGLLKEIENFGAK